MSNKLSKKSKINKSQTDTDFSSMSYKDMGAYEMMRFLIGKICVYFMFVIFPITMYDGYFYITASRARVFIVVSFLCFFAMIINEGIHIVCTRNVHRVKVPAYLILGAAFCASAVLAYCMSDYKDAALMGENGRYAGLVFVLALCCMYVTVSRCYRFGFADVHIIMIAACLINLLAVLNFIGVDVLGVFTHLAEWQKDIFLSTFGNIDVYGVYALFTAMMSLVLFLLKNSIKERAVFGGYLLINCMGLIVSNTDAAALGFLAGIVFLLYFMMRDLSALIRYCQMFLIVMLAGKMVCCLELLAGRTMCGFELLAGLKVCASELLRGQNTGKLDGLLSFLAYSNVSIWAIIFVSVLLVLLWRCSAKGKELPSRLGNIYKYAYAGVAAAAVAALIFGIGYANYVDNEAFGRYNVYFLFNDEWGSGRGEIWSKLMEAYGNLPVVNQIFGAGEGTVANVLTDYSSIHTSVIGGKNINDAHNILLHILVTQGVAGLLAYLAFYVYHVLNVIKLGRILCRKEEDSRNGQNCEGGRKGREERNGRKEWNSRKAQNNVKARDKNCGGLLSIGTAVLVCFIQGMFCLFEPIAFPIVFTALGMLNSWEDK